MQSHGWNSERRERGGRRGLLWIVFGLALAGGVVLLAVTLGQSERALPAVPAPWQSHNEEEVAAHDAPSLEAPAAPRRVVVEDDGHAAEGASSHLQVAGISAQPSSEAAAATLVVAVRSRETGRPVGGLSAGLRLDSGRARAMETTDVNGVVELEIPARIGGTVSIVESSTRNPLAESIVAALEPGELRRIEFEVPTAVDGRVHGRVLAVDGAQPIVGARVRLVHSHDFWDALAETVTDAGGCFELPAATWRESCIEIVAGGYASTAIAARVIPQAAEPDPLAIWLERTATLEIEVVDETGAAFADVHLLLEGESPGTAFLFGCRPEITWPRATTDASGRAVLADLHPGIALRVDAAVGGPGDTALSSEVTLEPGEWRRVRLAREPAATVFGRVVDQDGIGVYGRMVWLVDESQGGLRLPGNSAFTAAAETNFNGAFRMEGVQPGVYWVGLGALYARIDDLASLAVRTEVRAGSAVEVNLEATRALEITGSVVEADGTPSAWVMVTASHSEYGSWGANTTTDADGAFRLTGLLPGDYTVALFPHMAAPNANAVVRAGSTQVLLQQPGRTGVLQGRLEGFAGRGEVWISPPDSQSLAFTFASVEDGEFRFTDLALGLYDIFVTTSDGACGVLADVLLGATEVSVTVELAAGGTALVRNRCEEPAIVRVESSGAMVRLDSLGPGESRKWVVPAGEVVVESVNPATGQPIERVSGEVGTEELTELVLCE